MQYSELIEQYNAYVESANANGVAPDFVAFLARRDALVEDTRNALSAELTLSSMSRFNSHVQDEKRSMKIPAKEAK